MSRESHDAGFNRHGVVFDSPYTGSVAGLPQERGGSSTKLLVVMGVVLVLLAGAGRLFGLI